MTRMREKLSLTPEESATVERNRPTPSNPLCECSGSRRCPRCELIEIIDRLVSSEEEKKE